MEVGFSNLLGNIIPFMPLGFFLAPLVGKKYRTFSVFLLSVLCILVFEIIQFYSCLGCVDVDDLILNVSSSMVGCRIRILLRKSFL